MVDNNWTNFDKSVIPGRLDGLKIQTDASKPYYITYRTHNQGQGTYYPFVTSRENDYAGSAGKPIQLLSLYAYRNDGTKLVTGVVVMYRAYVEGRWLPWVSNANPEWMRSVQAKYNLDGLLDEKAYYAGIDGKNISGIEVRIFEENNANIPDTPQTPTGKHKIIDAPFISQMPDYPTGCESVATVMALQHAGVHKTVLSFINSYLYRTSLPFDPNISFGGDPRDTRNSYGCYSPVIKKALDKCFQSPEISFYKAVELKNVSLQQLCSDYIDKDIPVIMWATIDMKPWYNGDHWYYNGKKIQWIAPEHCLLLVGYDDEHYIFNDPLKSKPFTYYKKAAVEQAYAGLFSQAVIIYMDRKEAISKVCGMKAKNILSTFSMINEHLLSNKFEFDQQKKVFGSEYVDIYMTISIGMNFMPTSTSAIYNIKDGRIVIEAQRPGLSLTPGVMIPFIDFQNNGVSLKDIALQISSGDLAVTVKNINTVNDITYVEVAYTIYMPEIELPDGSTTEMSMEILQVIKQNRPKTPTEEEADRIQAIDRLEERFKSGIAVDWTLGGSYFAPMIGTNEAMALGFFGTLLIIFLGLLPT